MNRHPSVRWLCVAAAAIVASGTVAQAPTAAPDEAIHGTPAVPAPSHAHDEPSDHAPATVAGMKAYADPATGRLLDRPPPNAAPKALAPEPHLHAFDRVWEEALPDGTGLVHFEGAMEMSVVATVDADGNVVQACLPAAPAGQADAAPPGTAAAAAGTEAGTAGSKPPQP